MALGIPNLDQITTSLDGSYPRVGWSLDNASDMDKVEWQSPTLEQLDNWGANLDSLDTFGNLDSLTSLAVKQDSATASTTATATAEIVFAIEVDANVSTSATASAACFVIRQVEASVSTTSTATASFVPIRMVEASVSVTATATATPTPVRQVEATVDTSQAMSLKTPPRGLKRPPRAASGSIRSRLRFWAKNGQTSLLAVRHGQFKRLVQRFGRFSLKAMRSGLYND